MCMIKPLKSLGILNTGTDISESSFSSGNNDASSVHLGSLNSGQEDDLDAQRSLPSQILNPDIMTKVILLP